MTNLIDIFLKHPHTLYSHAYSELRAHISLIDIYIYICVYSIIITHISTILLYLKFLNLKIVKQILLDNDYPNSFIDKNPHE